MTAQPLIERVANAIEQPFLPHGYELKPHLLRSAARAAIEAAGLTTLQAVLMILEGQLDLATDRHTRANYDPYAVMGDMRQTILATLATVRALPKAPEM